LQEAVDVINAGYMGDNAPGHRTLAEEIRAEIAQGLDRTREIDDDELMEMVTEAVFRKSRASWLNIAQKRELADMVYNSMRKLDILQPMLDDKSITEIMVNGPDRIFIERAGRISRAETCFDDHQKLEDVIHNIVSRTNRTINEASPIVDFILPDGSRVNVVLRPVALNGPIMTIRKFPDNPMTLEQLTEAGSLTAEAAEFLDCLVKAKYNIFICGGTGSGKTTFLNALAGRIPPDERIITIEDSAELQIKCVDNIVRLETRNANSEGKGSISIRDLIRTSLRMRPERIIVGEVRGEEALDMLQAMNTGHDGSLSTGHANSAEDMLKRLETMVISTSPMPLDAVRQQIASAIDIMVHLGRLRDKTRRVLEISEISGCINGQIRLIPLFVFEETGNCDGGSQDTHNADVPDPCSDASPDAYAVGAGPGSMRNWHAGNQAGYDVNQAGYTGNQKGDTVSQATGSQPVKGGLKWTGSMLTRTYKLKMAGIHCRLGGDALFGR
jgi:pilus assembly protein CpaF